MFDGWYDQNGNRITGVNEGVATDPAAFASSPDFYAQLATRTTGDMTVTAHWKPAG